MVFDSVVVKPTAKHTATVIFMHGLGDTGNGWSPVFNEIIREPYIKYICPHAPEIPVSINGGMRMPAWFDVIEISPDCPEDIEGINEATKEIHELVESEIKAGIASERILIGGFSMGGSMALFSGISLDKKLAGIVAMSTFIIRREQVLALANNSPNKETPIFQAHGDADDLLPVALAHATADVLKIFNPNHQLTIYPGMAHSACDKELADLKQFIAKCLPPL